MHEANASNATRPPRATLWTVVLTLALAAMVVMVAVGETAEAPEGHEVEAGSETAEGATSEQLGAPLSPRVGHLPGSAGSDAAPLTPVSGGGDPKPASPAPAWARNRTDVRALGFDVRINGSRQIELPLESVFALPGDTIEVAARLSSGLDLNLEAEDGTLLEPGDGEWRWRWVAPDEPGMTRITIRRGASGPFIRLHAFTLVPADEVENGRLNGYRIGAYPERPLNANPLYLPPEGFIEVTEENREARVSPHFKLKHFPAKQGGGYPKYLQVRPALLLKLERTIEALADRGYPVTSLHVMSGYRTPFYNVSVLGNVKYSRHQWGGAADVFVDERPRNDRMDDLNGDGRVDVDDARVIWSIVDSLELDMGANFPVGGLGLYAPNSVRGPFVHMDVRGSRARW